MTTASIISIIVIVLTLGAAGFLAINGSNRAKNWLLGAVANVEKWWEPGTGVLKLRAVYDDFTIHFPVLKLIIPFAVFSKWVDATLGKLNEAMEEKEGLKDYIMQKEGE